MKLHLAAAIFATTLAAQPALAQDTLIDDLTSRAAQAAGPYSDIVKGGLKKLTCATLIEGQEQITYTDTDSFECRLKKSLEKFEGQQVVVNFPALAAVEAPDTENEFIALSASLPGRAALWVAAVRETDGQVANCVVNRPEFWGLLVSIGLKVVQELFFNPKREEELRFEAAAKYNAAVVFDAAGTADSVQLKQLIFSPRSAGPIINEACQFSAPEK